MHGASERHNANRQRNMHLGFLLCRLRARSRLAIALRLRRLLRACR